jgi:hypothetical protein
LDRYGTDDTSRAMIKYWFVRRLGSQYLSMAGPVIAGAGKIAFDSVGSDSWVAFFVHGVYALLILDGVIIFLFCFARFLFFSRKRLLRLLNAYHNGKPLSRRLKRWIRSRVHQKEKSR